MDWLLTLLNGLGAWHWLALGLIILVGEFATGSTYLLWPAAAAWLVGLLLLLAPIGWPIQFALFAAATIALTLLGRAYLNEKLLGVLPGPLLNSPAQDLIGRLGVVEQDFAHGVGRVRLADTVWRAESSDSLAAGARVEIIAVDGATLKVKSAAAAQIAAPKD